MTKKEIKLVKREGITRHYQYGNKVIEIGACLQPDVYVNPGYYISTACQDYKNPLLHKRFRKGKDAAFAALQNGLFTYQK